MLNYFTKVGDEYKDLPLAGFTSNYTMDLCEVVAGKSKDLYANMAISKIFKDCLRKY